MPCFMYFLGAKTKAHLSIYPKGPPRSEPIDTMVTCLPLLDIYGVTCNSVTAHIVR